MASTGLSAQQVPGVIVMELLSADAAETAKGIVDDLTYRRILVAFNARPEPHTLCWPAGAHTATPSLSAGHVRGNLALPVSCTYQASEHETSMACRAVLATALQELRQHLHARSASTLSNGVSQARGTCNCIQTCRPGWRGPGSSRRRAPAARWCRHAASWCLWSGGDASAGSKYLHDCGEDCWHVARMQAAKYIYVQRHGACEAAVTWRPGICRSVQSAICVGRQCRQRGGPAAPWGEGDAGAALPQPG